MLIALLHFVRDNRGQGLVEYALILGLVAIVAIVGLTALGSKDAGSITHSANQIP